MAEMDFTAANLNLTRKMNMMRTEPMMKLRQKEMKEHDLFSRLENSDDDDVDVDCSLNLGLPDDNPTHLATIFYGASRIHSQVGNNHMLVSGASAFRPWSISNSDHVTCRNNNNLNTGFIDFLGSTPVLASPRPTIPLRSAQCSECIDLNLAPVAETIEMNRNPLNRNPLQRAKVAYHGKSCAFCKKDNTPLWRNGPHGPKTLCNACGIRFKKQEKKALGITEAFPSPRNVGIKKPKI